MSDLTSLKQRIAELARMTGNSWSVTSTETQLVAIESFIKAKQGPVMVTPQKYPGPNLYKRLLELKLIKKGWAGEAGGEPISDDVIRQTLSLLDTLSKEGDILNPALCASQEGEMHIQWKDVIVEIDTDCNPTIYASGEPPVALLAKDVADGVVNTLLRPYVKFPSYE